MEENTTSSILRRNWMWSGTQTAQVRDRNRDYKKSPVDDLKLFCFKAAGVKF